MYSRRKALFSLASIVILTLLSLCAQATTWYVATNGNDTNPGTEAEPFQTIQRGIIAASDYDTVLVTPGTYNEYNIDFLGKKITVQGSSAFDTQLNCQGLGRAFLFVSGETSESKLSNIFMVDCLPDDTFPVTLEASLAAILFGEENGPYEDMPIPAGGAIRIVDSSPTISNCVILSSGAYGAGGAIAVSGGSPRIINSIFVGCFASLGGGIYADESDVTVINTLAFGISGYIGIGVFADGGSTNLINTTFTGSFAAEADLGFLGSTVVIAQNATALVANSILWGNETPANLYVADAGSSLTAQNSDIQGSGGSDDWNLPNITDAGNNIDADPLFLEIFIPAPDSPCIDTGDNALYNTYAAGITTCFFDIPRFSGARIDMGWIELPGDSTDTTPPVITTPGNLTATATSAAGATVTFTVTANDDVDGSVPVDCSPPSGSTFAPGTTTVTCTATDNAGNPATETFTVTVTYAWSGVLQPVNANGSSIFKAGSTVPVKFALTGASAGITDLQATLRYVKVSDGVPGTVNEAVSTSAATSGSLFRYDAVSGQYLFNWSTKGLSAGTYQLTINLGDGVEHTVDLRLK